jgi:hypothetical protein
MHFVSFGRKVKGLKPLTIRAEVIHEQVAMLLMAFGAIPKGKEPVEIHIEGIPRTGDVPIKVTVRKEVHNT